MIGTVNLGAGRVFLISNGVPYEVGEVTDVSLEYSHDVKEFKGGKTYPLTSAIVGQKLTGKVSSGTFYGALIAKIIGATTGTGGNVIATETASGTSFTPSKASDFEADLGVVDASGNVMKQVGTSPQVGEYSVNTTTGIYTFAAGEPAGAQVTYQYSVTTGQNTMTLTNGSPRVLTKFKLVVAEEFDGQKFGAELNAVTFPKLGLSMKAEDFTTADLEFTCHADATGTVGKIFY